MSRRSGPRWVAAHAWVAPWGTTYPPEARREPSAAFTHCGPIAGGTLLARLIAGWPTTPDGVRRFTVVWAQGAPPMRRDLLHTMVVHAHDGTGGMMRAVLPAVSYDGRDRLAGGTLWHLADGEGTNPIVSYLGPMEAPPMPTRPDDITAYGCAQQAANVLTEARADHPSERITMQLAIADGWRCLAETIAKYGPAFRPPPPADQR